MTWLTNLEFTSSTGILPVDSSVLTTALEFAEKDIIRHIFVSKSYITRTSTTTHRLEHYPMNISGTGTLTTSDVEAYEFDTSTNDYFDLSTSLVSVNSQEKKVEFDINVPTNGRELHLDYKTGRERFDKMLIELKELERLRASVWFYDKIPISKLQKGVSSWNINSVSVSFDTGATYEVLNNTNKIIKNLMTQLRPNTSPGFRPGKYGKQSLFYGMRRTI